MVGPPSFYDPERALGGIRRYGVETISPLGPAIIAAILKKAGFLIHYARMVPGNPQILENSVGQADIVAISCTQMGVDTALHVATLAQQKSKIVVVGGYGPTFNPDLFAQVATVVQGEFEPVAEVLIDALKRRRLPPILDATILPSYDITHQYILPDRTIFPPADRFDPFKFSSLETQRGCPNRCSFCSACRLQSGLRFRDPDDVIREIKEKIKPKRGSQIFLLDNNTTLLPNEMFETITAYLGENGLRWYSEGTVAALLENPERLRLMSPANYKDFGGCYGFTYGADDIGKVTATKENFGQDKNVGILAQAVEAFKGQMIPLHLSVVIGFDNHVFPDSFYQTKAVLDEAGAQNVFFHIATPYPGTPWGEKVRREERLLKMPSVFYNHRRVVFQPRQMTVEQLQQGYYWLLRHQFSPSRISENFERHFNWKIFQRNPFLGIQLTGLFWQAERLLALQELSLRGLIDWKVQKELDQGYLEWLSRGHSSSPAS